MTPNNTLPQLAAQIAQLTAQLEEAQTAHSVASALYAAPTLTMVQNNGSGLILQVPPLPEGAERLDLVHYPTEGEPFAITPTGCDQIPAGIVRGQFVFCGGCTSEVFELTILP